MWNLPSPLRFSAFKLLKCHHVYIDHMFLFQKATLAACIHRGTDTEGVMSSLHKPPMFPGDLSYLHRARPIVFRSWYLSRPFLRLAKCMQTSSLNLELLSVEDLTPCSQLSFLIPTLTISIRVSIFSCILYHHLQPFRFQKEGNDKLLS